MCRLILKNGLKVPAHPALWQSIADEIYGQNLYSIQNAFKSSSKIYFMIRSKNNKKFILLISNTMKDQVWLTEYHNTTVWNSFCHFITPTASNNPVQAHLLSALSHPGVMDHQFIYFLALHMEPDSGLWY